MISKRLGFALFYLIIGITGPILIQNSMVPFLVDKYEDGYTIGVEIEFTTVKPIHSIYDLEKDGRIIFQNGKMLLEQKYVFTPDTLPKEVEFHLETTEKHHSGVEFRKAIESNLGWIGPFPETFVVFGETTAIIGSIISGIQGFLLALRRKRIEEKGLYFYEINYIVIHYSKKITNVQNIE